MKTLLGGILVAIGFLIAGASGLCSLVGLTNVLIGGGLDALGALAMILIVGGIPFSIGFGLIMWGRSVLRSAAEDGE